MIGIIGAKTTIARAFRQIGPQTSMNTRLEEMPLDLDRYLICMGYLAGKRIGGMSADELIRTWNDNFVLIAQFCDRLFEENPLARVCIITSASGHKGSFDIAYAGAKAAMNVYIETTRVGRAQQLVGIAPTIIEDAGMTERRNDLAECMIRGKLQRRGHWLTAQEVARFAHFLLYQDTGAICNQVITMDGGLA